MLQLHAVSNQLLGVLNRLQKLSIFKNYRLVGGTALALQWGHRESIDIDLFGNDFIDSEEIISELKIFDNLKILKRGKLINIFVIEGIKVDIVNYNYKWLDEAIVIDGLTMASPKDIAAMKINAITGRGSKKDFIDLFFLLKHYSLKDIYSFFEQKYPDGTLFLAYKSLTYFDDADQQTSPKVYFDTTWEEIKEEIELQYKKLDY